MPKRPFTIQDDIAFIPLTKGYVAVIDAADLPLVGGFNWYARVDRRKDQSIRAVYAYRSEPVGDGKQKRVMMHRVIAGTPSGLQADHIDGDGLNNRRNNLRNVTTQQNQHNQRISSINTSGVKGVSWNKGSAKWQVRIRLAKKQYRVGEFDSIDAAAAAYAAASAKLHGAFGRTA